MIPNSVTDTTSETGEGHVYQKLHCFTYFLIALTMGLCGALAGQAQVQAEGPAQSPVPAVASAAAATATLRGHVADPTGARIPGAAITITTPSGAPVRTSKSDADGAFVVSGLAPGRYIVQAAYSGFAPFQSPAIPLTAGQAKRVDIQMAIEVAQQNVEVTDDSPRVSVEAGANANAIVIKGKDLDALSDDPDELANELQALAGPSAGPNGGQIYIDGFTGGELPPKSAIREIRINQNPFSAEFDKLGYGRIEIFTKPGTDKLHGHFFMQGNDNAFNTGNPFTPVPAYHSVQYNGTVSGPLAKWASYFVSVEQRNNQNASVYSFNQAPVLVSDPSTTCTSVSAGSCEVGSLAGSLFNPHTRTNISPRIDLQLGQKNTLTLRYQFYRNAENGDINSTSLPSQSSDTTSIEHTAQMSLSTIINDHLVNDARFEYRRASTSTTPASTDPQVSVPGVFSGGGSSSQQSSDHQDHLELHDLVTTSIGAHAITFGTWLRDNREANSTSANFNGSFNFPSVTAYVDTFNGLAADETFAQIAADCPPTQQGGCVPITLTYTTGNKEASANVFDAALFFQDDWKVNRNLTVSGGLRWESQNHIADHSDWGPRVAFAYALDGHKNHAQPKTVLRGGYGIFYDRMSVGQMLSAERFNGGANSQKQTTITDPTCFSPTVLDTAVGNCASGAGSTSTVIQIAPRAHVPYTQQFGGSLERQLTKTTTLTFTYLHSYGLHRWVTRDSNAYNPAGNPPGDYTFNPGGAPPTITGTRPDPSLGIVDQYDPEAIYKQNQLIVNVNAHLTPRLSVFGFYNLTAANTNGASGTASNSYNINQDYGRADFAARNMVFMMADYQGPWGVSFNPFLIAISGKPFNIVTPYDLTGDNFFNNRPSYATAASDRANVVVTRYGDFDTIPQAGETIIPAYLGTGPAAVALNLRVSRSFGIGPKVTGNAAGGPPPGGGGHGDHHHGGGPGGGFGPGGFNGGGGPPHGMFGGDSVARKYSLTFSVHALNLFNNIDYGTPVGNVTAQNFGRSTNLNGGIFSSGAAARRIYFQAIFAF